MVEERRMGAYLYSRAQPCGFRAHEMETERTIHILDVKMLSPSLRRMPYSDIVKVYRSQIRTCMTLARRIQGRPRGSKVGLFVFLFQQIHFDSFLEIVQI